MFCTKKSPAEKRTECGADLHADECAAKARIIAVAVGVDLLSEPPAEKRPGCPAEHAGSLRPANPHDLRLTRDSRLAPCDYRGATPRPRTRAPTSRIPSFTSFGFDPTGTRYSTSISVVIRSARRSSADWNDAAE